MEVAYWVLDASIRNGSPLQDPLPILGGSWVVISRVRSPLIWVITIVTLLIAPLITTHEPPPSRPHQSEQGISCLVLAILWSTLAKLRTSSLGLRSLGQIMVIM